MKTALRIALAWTPLYVLWVLFILTYDDTATLRGAAIGAITAPATAAVLGLLVWTLTGYVRWPDLLRPGFYGLHLVSGSLYAAAWVGIGYVVASLRSGEPLLEMLAESRVLGWQFIMGLVLYGLVAGVSYAIRAQARLQEQRRVAARAEALAARARLDALRARVNPHFLFNALHSVLALVRDAPAAAERAIEQLGDLLRYALDDGGAGGDRLFEDEWAFTRDYLDLERLRFEDRLRIEVDVAAPALAVPLPPLTLQPVVENAVRHALGASTRPVTVRVSAHVGDGRLVISVADDGPGAPAADVDSSAGTGLRSLRERLLARYGPAASVAWRTAPGNGFEVRIDVPSEGSAT